MQRSLVRILRVFCLSALVLCLTRSATADQARDFAATYHFSNVSESGDSVHLTITLTLHNYKSSSVNGGGVVLFDSAANRSALGAFNVISKLPAYGKVTLSGTFSVPRAEYTGWVSGKDPVLNFLLRGPSGAVQTEDIDLTRDVQPAATE